MNDNAKKWVEALESGEYDQCTNMLKDEEGGYCCLGVACELYSKDHPEAKWERSKLFGRSPDTSFVVPHDGTIEARSDILPIAVQEWLGLEDECGCFNDVGKNKSLTQLNDEGTSFRALALLIRSEPENLFHVEI